MTNFKSVKMLQLGFFPFQLQDLRQGRAVFQPFMKPAEYDLISRGPPFNVTIRQVPYPSRNARQLGPLPGRLPKKHALDKAAHSERTGFFHALANLVYPVGCQHTIFGGFNLNWR